MIPNARETVAGSKAPGEASGNLRGRIKKWAGLICAPLAMLCNPGLFAIFVEIASAAQG